MSFGASPSDIIIVVTFCKALYRKCRDAGGEYDEISREVRGLHTVLRHLKYEVEAPDSPLNRDSSIWGRQLAPIIGNCDFTLRNLDELLAKYGRLSNNGTGSPTTPRILWDKMRFGSNEMDQLGGIRVKLISHKTSLTLFLDTIQLHQSGKMAMALDNHGGQLDVILDKVDSIAERMTQKSGSVMTNYEGDDQEVWKQFRRELVAEGFSSDVLQQHKDVLRAYIREIDQKGLLNEVPTDSQLPPPPVGSSTERWLESVQTGSSKDVPPSFNSLNTATDDSGAKEMVIREDNMKFPPSMKLERPKPETRRDGVLRTQLEIPGQQSAIERRRSGGSQRHLSPASKPKLITSDEKQDYYLNTDSSSDEESETDHSIKRSKSPLAGQIIKTSDLIAQSQALTIRPPGSPISFRSSQGSFLDDDDHIHRSMASRAKKQVEFGASPPRTGPIPVPNANDRLSTSPRPEPIRLAPDAQGNEILPDAKWTKIARHLVSPEVLDQDRLRYEARPDFVAILGVLSRAEIQSLATRSHDLRLARHRRNHPLPQNDIPPPQPPRPIPVPIPAPVQQSRARGGRDTPSSESDHHSSDSEHNRPRRRRPEYKEHRSYPNYTHSPSTGYPNPFGQPVAPPSPVRSPVSGPGQQPMWMPQPPPKGQGGGLWIPASPQQGGAMLFPPSRGEGRERDKDRELRRRRSSPPRSREREAHRKEEKKGRWMEHLTAASIGGAAVSLLNVLSEAAEGL